MIEYEGIFIVQSPEFDDAGYFIDIEHAKAYAYTNWEGLEDEK